jgi:hypothetical protein
VSDEEELGHLLSTFRSSAWRLEALDWYLSPGEAPGLAAFLRGDPCPPSDPELEEWLAVLRQLPSQGRTLGRVHTIVGPLTPYLRYEIEWGYAPMATAGEDIRILHRRSWADTPFGWQPPDFWLIDDSVAAVMRYDSDGRWLGMDLLSEPSELDHYRSLRDLAVDHAVPLAAYLAAIRATPLDPSELVGQARSEGRTELT